MITLVLSVLLASLLGSLHCAGMCGVFVVIALSPKDVPAWRLNTAYHAGRLLIYLTLGLSAGVIGSTLDLGASLAGMQNAAIILAGFSVLAFGLITLLRRLNVVQRRIALPRFAMRFAEWGHRRAAAMPPVNRAMSIGLLTAVLPCGWLWAFVMVAAGTAHPLAGGAVMVAFWMGTLPALVAVGAAARALAGPIGRFAPGLACAGLMLAGAWTVLSKGGVLGLHSHDSHTHGQSHVHLPVAAITASEGPSSNTQPGTAFCEPQPPVQP